MGGAIYRPARLWYRALTQTQNSQAIGSINSSRVLAAFVGPVVSTSILAWSGRVPRDVENSVGVLPAAVRSSKL
jgi:hypothetical protein